MPKRSGVAQRAYELAAPIVSELGLDLVDCEYKKDGSALFLRVFVDKKGGISIDECETVSKALDPLFDEKLSSNHDYFEVSSPGLDRPLQTPEDFNRHLKEKVNVSLYQQIEGKKKFSGILVSAGEENFNLLCNDNNEITITYAQTATCRRVIEF